MWDAETAVCLEVIPGMGDIRTIATGAKVHAIRVIARGAGTVIESLANGDEMAWFPDSSVFVPVRAPSLVWAGSVSNHILLIRLEGAVSVSS